MIHNFDDVIWLGLGLGLAIPNPYPGERKHIFVLMLAFHSAVAQKKHVLAWLQNPLLPREAAQTCSNKKINVSVICMLMCPQPVPSPREAPDVVRRGREC